MAALDYATLLGGIELTERVRTAVFGYETDKLLRHHPDVEQTLATGWSLEAGRLRVQTQESGAGTRSQYLDAAKRVTRYEDESGNTSTYTYDALGRLRGVGLPDGAGHWLTYDAYGRVGRVERDGVAKVDFEYTPGTWLMSAKRFRTPADTLVRSELYQYDGAGRRTVITHANAAGGTKQFLLYYDGATPSAPANTSLPGLLTATAGDGYTKRMEYRADGLLAKTTVSFTGWRTVETEVAYTENGEVDTEVTRVKDAGGAVLNTTTLGYDWDAWGRMSALTLNGQPWATVQYNGVGKTAKVDFGGGTFVELGYDALTRERTSLAQKTPTWASSIAWKLNTRGLTGTESLDVGGTPLTRQYDYSPRGFLTGAWDSQHTYAYGFDAAGLPRSISDDTGTRTLVVGGNTLVAGGVTYVMDGLGRTVSRDDLTLTYGADGQVATAQKGAHGWSFFHDEDGERLLKRDASGAPLAAYLKGGGYLDATGLTLPVRVDGQLVGALQNGTFRLSSTDRRGTVLADADGTARLPSPFGDRAIHPTGSAALDFVEKAYDADLGFVRMGVRDYDPRIHRFTTPDPLFLEDLEKCRESPVECNLYSYVSNRPLDLVDPTGTEEKKVTSGDPVGNMVSVAAPVAVAAGVRVGGPKVVSGVKATYSLGKRILNNPVVSAVRKGNAAIKVVKFIGGCIDGSNPLCAEPPSQSRARFIREGIQELQQQQNLIHQELKHYLDEAMQSTPDQERMDFVHQRIQELYGQTQDLQQKIDKATENLESAEEETREFYQEHQK
ncbi:hypothetical protein LZ198_08170 [Myxococcus sp. K15C18031901]|nr:hypothetical protein [Myxococcus dinghuensis]